VSAEIKLGVFEPELRRRDHRVEQPEACHDEYRDDDVRHSPSLQDNASEALHDVEEGEDPDALRRVSDTAFAKLSYTQVPAHAPAAIAIAAPKMYPIPGATASSPELVLSSAAAVVSVANAGARAGAPASLAAVAPSILTIGICVTTGL
jgi:hypothetical protein